jgi:RHS repeat-associated protein
MFRRNLFFLCESILLVVALAVVVAAQDETPLQVTNQNRSGDLPFSTSIGTGAEQVDLASGSLKIRIPIISIKGRGLDYNFTLRYDTAFWATATRFQTGTGYYQKWNIELRNYLSSTNPGLGWETNTPSNSHSVTSVSCLPGSAKIYGHFIHTDSEGAKHPLFIQQGNDCVTGFIDTPEPDSSYAGISAQLAGSLIWPPITSADGTTLSVVYPGLTSVNSNGNSQVYGTSSTDTLGRTIVTQQNGTNQILYKVYDSGGNQQTYTVNFVNSSVVTSFNVSGPYGLIQESGSIARSLVSSIVLPNGRSYAFQYETGTYGGLTRIDLPSGAYVTYTWGTFPDGDRTHRYVTSRTVHVDSQSYPWTISCVCVLMDSHCKTIQSTITDPANNQAVYNSQSGDITLAQIYQGSAVGTPLRQYAIDYQGGTSPTGNDIGGVPIRITTTLDNGQVSKKEFDYEWFTFTYTQCSDSYGGCTPGTIGSTSRGNVTEIREYDWGSGASGPLMRRTDNSYLHNSNSTYLTYNIVNKIISQTVYDGSGTQKAQTQYEYDNYVPTGADSNPLLSTTAVAQHDYTKFSTSFIYRGNATRVKRWRDTDSALLTTTYQYDDLGNIRLIRDPLANTTSFSYTDSFANSFCAPPTGKSGQAWVSQVTNSLTQNLQIVRYPCTGLVQAHKDQNDINASRAGTTYSYDLLGRATQKNLPDGGQVATSYNDVPPVSSTSTTKITSTVNLVTTATQDGLGRARKTQLTSDPDATTYTRLAYDGLGRKFQEWNPTRCDPDMNPSSCSGEPTFGVTSYSYDALSRVTQVIPPDGTSSANNVTTVYTGNTTTVSDQARKSRTNQTDALGRLTTVWEDPGAVPHLNYETDYQYDVVGNLLRVDQKGGDSNSANWRTRTFIYNSLSQLLTANNPESGIINYGYDNDGNLLTRVSPAPNQTNPSVTQTISYCYDQLNRLTGKGYSSQTCPLTTPAASYFYDQTSYNGLTIANGIGRRTGMSDAAGAEAWNYDAMGRSLRNRRTTNSVTLNTDFTYNADGSVATEVYPSGRTITYTAGAAGRALEAKDVANSINYLTGATYAPQGALYKFANGSSISGAMTYNSRLQPLQLYFTTGTVSSGTLTQLQQSACPTATATIMSRSYNFALGTNDNGNALSTTNCRDTNRTQNFDYDNLNRIAHAYTSGPNWGEAFTIDAWGNLTNEAQYLGKTNHEGLNAAPATAKNQLTGYAYDAAGNMTTGGYTYDPENRLATAGGVTYTYDGDGNRVKKSSGTLYWGAGPLAEGDLTGSATSWKEYVFFGGKRVARRDASNSSVHYFFSDHLGSTSVTTNSPGATLEEDIDYYPYGGIVSGSSSDHYLFTGKERDSESGLDNFGARYNASSMGRFMSPDPSNVSVDFWMPQTWNRYSYALNNPLKIVDRNGLWPTDIHNEIINQAFPGLSQGDRTELIEASYDTDYNNRVGGHDPQDPEVSYVHGMSDGVHNQDPAQAQQEGDAFIAENEHDAQQIQAEWVAEGNTGIAPAALTAFGNALHTIEDRTSPAHVGNQPWYGTKGLKNKYRALQHVRREATINRAQMNASVAAARQAFRQTFGNEFEWLAIQQHQPKACVEAHDSSGQGTGTTCQ